MGLLDNFSGFMKTPEGMGLLSALAGGLAGANRGTPINNLGRAGLAGVMGYGSALDRQERTAENAVQNQLRQAQMAEFARKQKIAEAQQAWLQNANAPEEVKAGVVPFEKWWERQNPKIEPYTLTPGSKRYGVDNSVVAEVPIERKLPEGMQLDANGNLVEIPGYVSMKQKIAAAGRAPAQPAQPYYSPVVDAKRGVGTFDHRTGQMKWDQPTPVIKPADSPELQGQISNARKAGEGGGEFNMKQYEAAQAAVPIVQKIDEQLKIINSGNTTTGYAADLRHDVNRAVALLGSKAASGKVSDTEVLEAMMGSDVFGMITTLGVGARGLDTPAEREFMRQVLTGTKTLNQETLQRMAIIRRDVAQRTINKFNARIDSGELDQFFATSGLPKKRIEVGGGQGKSVVKTGSYGGRKVIQYSDGSIDYAD